MWVCELLGGFGVPALAGFLEEVAVAFFGQGIASLFGMALVVEVFGEAPGAFGFYPVSVRSFGGELFSFGPDDDFFERLGLGVSFFLVELAAIGIEIDGRRELARGEAHDGDEHAGDTLVDGFGGDGAGEIGEDLLDVVAVVEARDLDAGGHARGDVAAAVVASVGEAVELAAEGEAATGVSAGFDVAALHAGYGCGFGHGTSSAQCSGLRAQGSDKN